jgi:molecular chaperone DnaK (HSP70)
VTGARFVVGIDLGTTNSAVAFADTTGDGAVASFPVPQVVSAGELHPLATLPSFVLLPTAHEVPPEAMALPWDPAPGYAVGVMARERGADLPHRLISSAKSWLSHTGVDRSEAILPWIGTDAEAHEPGARLSPVDAQAMILAHVRAAWDHAHPDAPLDEQDVFLTVPASFDAIARELTMQAARTAGLPAVTLLEEPQAAFYAWLAGTGDRWRTELGPGDAVLVCDVGGGTTDFSIIAVADDGGNLALERVAVGDHILLGGDNMDLALAHAAGLKLGDKLGTLQQRALVHACRRAKEQLLSDGAPAKVPVTVLARGSRLIGGTLRTELGRADVEALILDGFFPRVAVDARPQRRRALGLRELGLPYAHDPAITRHMAEFLARHGRAPTAILFNGGVMKGEALRARVADVTSGWFGHELRALAGNDLDLAVAHGAAYYGLVRRGRGVRIRGGTGRSYYIGIEAAMPAIPGFAPPVRALCVAPFGMEEGTRAPLPLAQGDELGLVVGETAQFRFFAATDRKDDRPGAVVDPDDAHLDELAPVETTLPAGGDATPGAAVPVSLESHVTELGTLELWCVARDGQRWKLEYQVREVP